MRALKATGAEHNASSANKRKPGKKAHFFTLPFKGTLIKAKRGGCISSAKCGLRSLPVRTESGLSVIDDCGALPDQVKNARLVYLASRRATGASGAIQIARSLFPWPAAALLGVAKSSYMSVPAERAERNYNTANEQPRSRLDAARSLNKQEPAD